MLKHRKCAFGKFYTRLGEINVRQSVTMSATATSALTSCDAGEGGPGLGLMPDEPDEEEEEEEEDEEELEEEEVPLSRLGPRSSSPSVRIPSRIESRVMPASGIMAWRRRGGGGRKRGAVTVVFLGT